MTAWGGKGILPPHLWLIRLLHATHSRNLTPPRNPLIFCVSAVNCYFLGVVWVTKVYIELHASMHRWLVLCQDLVQVKMRTFPILTRQKLSLSVCSFIYSFEFIWWHIVTMAMNSFRIVESFQIFENQAVCLLVIVNFKAVEPFTFDNRMEGFNAGIIPRKCFLWVTTLHIFCCFFIFRCNILTAI